MTVNNTTATLNEPLQIYQYDRGITLRIKVLRYKYYFNKLTEEDMVAESGILSARAIVLKPDGVGYIECPRQKIEDDCVIINITLDWTDETTEIGKYKLQIQLYGEDYINERVTLPPVDFTVAPMVKSVPEEGLSIPAVADAGFLNVDYIADTIGEIDDGELPYGVYDITTWKPGDVITAEELNKSEKAIEYLIRVMPDKVKAVYTPAIDENGFISWTNDLDWDNPEPVNIMGPEGPMGPRGPEGPQGEAGTSIKILGSVPNEMGLNSLVDSSEPGDSYLVENTREVWTLAPNRSFVNLGTIQGPEGPKGDKGDPLTYDELTQDQKAELQKGFITSTEITRIEIVTQYPVNEEDGVLYIRVEE